MPSSLCNLDAFKNEGSLNVQAGTAFVDFKFIEELYYVDAEDRESLWTCFCDTNGFPKVAVGVHSFGHFNLATTPGINDAESEPTISFDARRSAGDSNGHLRTNI
ncbi:uncharacterized protein [Arachis hypogaea]|uniref:uncharacterized protein isoform X2 n=1 Tax=Arachis hypogaea TaxID=3818 RepID=UPI003B228324